MKAFTMAALSCLVIVAFAWAQTPPSVTTNSATIKALQAQNLADGAVIASTQKMIDTGADNPAQLQAIITAKRLDIEKNTRAIEGMSHGAAISAIKQSASSRVAPSGTHPSVEFEYDDANGNMQNPNVKHSVSFQAYNAKAPHGNWAQLDTDGNGITIHVRFGDSGLWQHRGKMLIAVP